MYQATSASMFTRSLLARVVLGASALLGVSGIENVAQAQPLTYQGKLTESGLPANGMYEMRFRAFPALLGGLQLGSTDTVNNVNVTDGLFTVQIDMLTGVPLTGELYLEIEVRAAGSGGAFVLLSPRTRMTPAPLSLLSLNDRWSPSGSNMVRSNTGITNVLVGTTTPIYFDSILTLNRTTTTTNLLSGMYVDGSLSNSQSYYGWATAGVSRAEIGYNGGSNRLELTFGNFNALSILNNGQVGIGGSPVATEKLFVAGDIRSTGSLDIAGPTTLRSQVIGLNDIYLSGEYRYDSPRARRISIAASSFISPSSALVTSLDLYSTGAGYVSTVGAATMVAPVQLPSGAVITRVAAYLIDNSTENLTASLVYVSHTGTVANTIASIVTSGASSSVRLFENTSPTFHTVSHGLNTYTIFVSCPDWGGATVTGVKSVIVDYTVPNPD